jgi:hypothetical protein
LKKPQAAVFAFQKIVPCKYEKCRPVGIGLTSCHQKISVNSKGFGVKRQELFISKGKK